MRRIDKNTRDLFVAISPDLFRWISKYAKDNSLYMYEAVEQAVLGLKNKVKLTIRKTG